MPAEVPEFKTLRLRQADDTISKLKENGECALSILKRDEWAEDLDCVVTMSSARKINRAKHGSVRRFKIHHGDEEIYAVKHEIMMHDWQEWPMKLEMNRFIVGRPNPIRVPIIMGNQD